MDGCHTVVPLTAADDCRDAKMDMFSTGYHGPGGRCIPVGAACRCPTPTVTRSRDGQVLVLTLRCFDFTYRHLSLFVDFSFLQAHSCLDFPVAVAAGVGGRTAVCSLRRPVLQVGIQQTPAFEPLIAASDMHLNHWCESGMQSALRIGDTLRSGGRQGTRLRHREDYQHSAGKRRRGRHFGALPRQQSTVQLPGMRRGLQRKRELRCRGLPVLPGLGRP